MTDVRLIGSDENGKHLILDLEGTELHLPVDDALRAALREATQLAARAIDPDAQVRDYTPREIQAMMRAGRSVQDVAVESGWAPERVAKFEPPILAERDHIATLAREVPMRSRTQATTLGARVNARLKERGVDPETAEWEALRPEGGHWIVRVTFVAAGKERAAEWSFDVPSRKITAENDEALWLGEDEVDSAADPVPATPARAPQVFDVESQGGLTGPRAVSSAAPRRPRRADGHSEPVDLMSAMRERTAGRRGRSGGVEESAELENEALPLEEFEQAPVTRPRAEVELEAWDEDDLEDGAEAPAEQEAPASGKPNPARRDTARPEPKPRKGTRRSVPSWDDIMFGKKD